jgi:hypothetical protein
VATTRPVDAQDLDFRTLRDVSSLEDLGGAATSALALGRATFGHAESEAETRQHLLGDRVILALDGDRVVAVSVLSLTTVVALRPGLSARHAAAGDEVVAHLQGTVIDPGVRGRGLYRELNRRRFATVLDQRIRFVTTMTQNPRVERGIRSLLVEFTSLGHLAGWTLDAEARPGAYGQLLVAGQSEVEGTPLAGLDAAAGDAVSLVFSLSH